MGLLKPPYWQEHFHFHGDFGEKLEISWVFALNCSKRTPLLEMLHPMFVFPNVLVLSSSYKSYLGHLRKLICRMRLRYFFIYITTLA